MTVETKVYIALEDDNKRRLVVDGDIVLLRRLFATLRPSRRPQEKDQNAKISERPEVRA